MIKKAITLCFALLMMQGAIHAQTQMTVPHGSFEQWTSHTGYSVSVMGMSLPVYDSYSTPTGWGYLAYPVNETFNVFGSTTVTVNTSLPLIKVSQETGSVPDSNKALKLQTFMLNEIVTGLVYTLAAPNLDTMLTQTVFPSIMLTGTVNMDSLIPIVTSLLANIDSVEDMLVGLAETDVNNLITGGIALGSFVPSRLTGSYKYHSGDSVDNGGVLMLGTHYNTTTHRREVVGGGLNIALTDAANYTPFTVDYMSLHELDASYAEQAPDSLIILLVSSASENREQGSYLCVDNLRLWQDSTGTELPDTCASIVGLTATPDIHEAELNWGTTDAVDGYELEYGAAGFAQGSGTMMYPTGNTASLSGLAANTAYDVYVRTVCNATTYSDWASVSFTTQPDTCASISSLGAVHIDGYDGSFPLFELQWHGTSLPDHWEVEYGPQGFVLGSGTVVETGGNSFAIYELEQQGMLQPNTWYDFYVRSVCEGDVYGDWDSVHYRTFCATVEDLEVDLSNAVVTVNDVSGVVVKWQDTTDTEQWMVRYYCCNDAENEHVEYVDTTVFNMPPLTPGISYSVFVSSLCGQDNYGEELCAKFVTPMLEGIAEADASTLSVSPNPANGRCVVSLADNTPAELKLYGTDGRLLQTVVYKGAPIELQLPSQGVYLLQATTATGTSVRKIVNK